MRLANDVAGRLWGEPAAALAGRALAGLLEPAERTWEELAATVGAPVEMRARRPSAEPVPVEVALGPVGSLGRPLRLVAVRDVSARRAREVAIARSALRDPLTRLANRLAFEDRLRLAIDRAERYGGLVAVHLLDLDGFKAVNDRHGHRVGDAVLVAFAERLRPIVRASDTLARLGGDEFALLQGELRAREGAGAAARRLLASLAAPLEVGALRLTIAASIGTALYPLHGRTPEALWEAADRALYAAKRSGGGAVLVATPDPADGPVRPADAG